LFALWLSDQRDGPAQLELPAWPALPATAWPRPATVWKTLPSWYLVAAADEALPPDAERLFATRMGATTVEIPSSHVAMVSHPGEVAKLIETAAEAVLAAS
jgi:pimeloyl-ACP methyl ester carboxylesterase